MVKRATGLNACVHTYVVYIYITQNYPSTLASGGCATPRLCFLERIRLFRKWTLTFSTGRPYIHAVIDTIFHEEKEAMRSNRRSFLWKSPLTKELDVRSNDRTFVASKMHSTPRSNWVVIKALTIHSWWVFFFFIIDHFNYWR